MGKITVKHYLNTRVKPLELADREFYPIYVQVTVDRRTTQIRSFTNGMCTITGMQEYEKTGHFDKLEWFPSEPLNLNREQQRIEDAIKYIIRRKIDISKKYSLRYALDQLFVPVKKVLLTNLWEWLIVDKGIFETEVEQKTHYGQLYNTLNPEFTISHNISEIKRLTGLDLTPYIYPRNLELSEDIDVFLDHIYQAGYYSFIDIITIDYTLIINSLKLHNKDELREHIDNTFGVHIAGIIDEINQ